MDGAADGEPLAGADPGRSRCARGRYVHWLAWGIAPDTGGLAEGEAAPLEGANDFGSVGYRGPCPPRGRHRYRFRLHALGVELRLAPGAGVGELERTLTGNLLAVAELVGTYER
jgi:Raf kinase inhibitor-like YbhB/YbcL family protein